MDVHLGDQVKQGSGAKIRNDGMTVHCEPRLHGKYYVCKATAAACFLNAHFSFIIARAPSFAGARCADEQLGKICL